MEQAAFEDSAFRTLEHVRGSKCFSDTTPTVWMNGHSWPPYEEVVTRYPLCGASKLNVFVDCVEGQSTLTFGLISPNERRLQMLGTQNGEQLRLTGKLWAWNSKLKQIFTRPFDSRTSYGSSTQITHFYDNEIKTGSVLCVYHNLKTNRIHFVINGTEEAVSFSSGAPDFCYGFVRLCSRDSHSNIQATLMPEKDEAYFNPSPPTVRSAHMVEPESLNICWVPVVRVGQAIHQVVWSFLSDLIAKQVEKEREITELSHYRMNTHHPRGICLIINNVPNLVSEAEKQLTDIFKDLFFDVQIRRSLQMLQIYEVAQEFARKDHSLFDSFVVIVMSICQDNEISGVDGRKASLEHVMSEFTATKCPTLQGKPKMFFVQRFSLTTSSTVGDGSTQAQCCTDKEVEMRPFCPGTTNGEEKCPEEADYLLICVTSLVDEAKRVPDLFIQVLIKVIRKYRHRYHLLELLTEVNKRVLDKQHGVGQNRAMTVHVPYLTHTLRAKVHLGWTPAPLQAAVPDGVQRNCYGINRRPRGYCVIINNSKFQDKAMNRPGAEEDERNLKQLFKELSFKVIVEKNLTKPQMERVAVKYGSANHSAFDAFVLIVMSHGGDRDCLLGVDGRETTVKNLMVEFRESKCPSLKKKPKVFIIQTCRGIRDDTCKRLMAPAGNISQAVASTSAQVDNESTESYDAALLSDSTLPRSVFPQEADFVLAFATVPGYVAFRVPEYGTFFIQTLVEVIRKYHHRHHFLEILTEVTKLVVERQNNMAHPVQVPAPMHTMTKLLYL